MRWLFYSSSFRIQKILFDEASLKQQSSIEVYSGVQTALLHKNYLSYRMFDERETLEQLQKSFPYLISLHYSWKGNQTLFLHMDFAPPSLLFQIDAHTWIGSYHEKLYQIPDGDMILSGIIHLSLPKYISSFEALYGVFSES